MKEERNRILDKDLMQRVIDPITGRDITGEYINERLIELEKIANNIIKSALSEYKKNPEKKINIYEKTFWLIHEKLGMGSIGPATAAAGPLMDEKKRQLAKLLEVDERNIIL